MCTIILKDKIESSKLLSDSGSCFYDRVIAASDTSEKVVVDMSEVTSLPSIFLNVSIGRLIDDWGIDKLKETLSFVMITKQQTIRLKSHIDKYINRDNQ